MQNTKEFFNKNILERLSHYDVASRHNVDFVMERLCNCDPGALPAHPLISTTGIDIADSSNKRVQVFYTHFRHLFSYWYNNKCQGEIFSPTDVTVD